MPGLSHVIRQVTPASPGGAGTSAGAESCHSLSYLTLPYGAPYLPFHQECYDKLDIYWWLILSITFKSRMSGGPQVSSTTLLTE